MALWRNIRPAPQSLRVTDLPGRQIQPTVSPDGSRLAFAWDADGYGGFQIYLKEIKGGSIVPLTPGPTLPEAPPGRPTASPSPICEPSPRRLRP